MTDVEYMLRQYLAFQRIRRDLASIMGDSESELDARDSEDDGQLAVRMVRAEVW